MRLYYSISFGATLIGVVVAAALWGGTLMVSLSFRQKSDLAFKCRVSKCGIIITTTQRMLGTSSYL